MGAGIEPEVRTFGLVAFVVSLMSMIGLFVWMNRRRRSVGSLDPIDEVMYQSFDRAESARLIREGLYAITHCGRNEVIQANVLCKLARFSFNQADYAAAKSLFRESLALTRKVCGEGHTDCAVALSEMAMLVEVMGDYDEAERLYRRAHDVLVSNLGERHVSVAKCLSGLARVHSARSDLDSAEGLLRKALEIIGAPREQATPSTPPP